MRNSSTMTLNKTQLLVIEGQVKAGIPVLADTWERVLATAIEAVDEVAELDRLIQEWKLENERLQERMVSRRRP